MRGLELQDVLTLQMQAIPIAEPAVPSEASATGVRHLSVDSAQKAHMCIRNGPIAIGVHQLHDPMSVRVIQSGQCYMRVRLFEALPPAGPQRRY